jgi:hypothetical protein
MQGSQEVRWTDIAGLDSAKATLNEIVVLPTLRPDVFTGDAFPDEYMGMRQALMITLLRLESSTAGSVTVWPSWDRENFAGEGTLDCKTGRVLLNCLCVGCSHGVKGDILRHFSLIVDLQGK